MSALPRRRRPWHLWLFAVTILALYVMGGLDFLRIQAGNAAYVADTFGPRGADYFDGYPFGLRALWAVNLLAGVSAPLLLMARHRWSAPTAALATIAQAVLLVVTFASRDRWEALGAPLAWFDIGIGAVTAVFALYCYRMRRITARW